MIFEQFYYYNFFDAWKNRITISSASFYSYLYLVNLITAPKEFLGKLHDTVG